MPSYVYKELPKTLENKLDVLEKYAIISKSPTAIANVCDCTEGLENAFKKAALQTAPLTETLTSARYTTSRIRRIALQNLLNIDETVIRSCLQSPLYLRVLAAKKTRSDVLSVISESQFPVIVRAHDEKQLNDAALQCWEADTFAESVYQILYPKTSTDKSIFI